MEAARSPTRARHDADEHRPLEQNHERQQVRLHEGHAQDDRGVGAEVDDATRSRRSSPQLRPQARRPPEDAPESPGERDQDALHHEPRRVDYDVFRKQVEYWLEATTEARNTAALRHGRINSSDAPTFRALGIPT